MNTLPSVGEGTVRQFIDTINSNFAAITASGAIDTVNIATNAIVETKISNGAVTETKISDGAVTETKISDGAVTYNKLSSELKTLIFDIAHPVGSYYWTTNSSDTTVTIRGTWEQIKDRFILAAGDTYSSIGATGGSASHTLTINEMPSHNHYRSDIKKYLEVTAIASGALDVIANAKSGYGTESGYVTGSTGGGVAHNNMPPYEVAYCWKRLS